MCIGEDEDEALEPRSLVPPKNHRPSSCMKGVSLPLAGREIGSGLCIRYTGTLGTRTSLPMQKLSSLSKGSTHQRAWQFGSCSSDDSFR
jgi:hypothetical protein